MQHFVDLIETLLRDFEPSPTEKQSLKNCLEKFKNLQNEISDTITADILTKERYSLMCYASEVQPFRTSPEKVRSLTKESALERVFYDCSQLHIPALKAYQHKTYQKYHEIYKTISNEELTANSEYTKVDEELERISKPSTSEINSFFRTLGDFFEIPEYQEFYNKRNF